jgi:hypothetical protein
VVLSRRLRSLCRPVRRAAAEDATGAPFAAGCASADIDLLLKMVNKAL